MKKKFLGRSGWKSALEPVLLASIALSLPVGGATILLEQKFDNPSSSNVPQTSTQKVEVFARVVHDVDAIKKS